MIHITGRGNFIAIDNAIRNGRLTEYRYLNILGEHKDLIGEDVNVAMITALYFWEENSINNDIKDAGTTVEQTFNSVLKKINRYELSNAEIVRLRKARSRTIMDILNKTKKCD